MFFYDRSPDDLIPFKLAPRDHAVCQEIRDTIERLKDCPTGFQWDNQTPVLLRRQAE